MSKLSNEEVLHISARPFVDICWCASDFTGFWTSSNSFRKSGAFGFETIVYWSVIISKRQESGSGTKQNIPSKEKLIFNVHFHFIAASPALMVVAACPREKAGAQTQFISHQFIAGPHAQFTPTLTLVNNVD